jgi:predicted short-subunit dehydrogenase-like oxidoreductase (DUF2520 family)
MKKIIGIVGAGNVGLSLAEALARKELDVLILSDHYLGPMPFVRRQEARAFLERCTAAIICVKDRDIREIAALLASADAEISRKPFLHTAGGLDSSALSSLRDRGASVGVMHPIQSFPMPDPKLIEGIYMGVSGDKEAVNLAEEIARALGCQIIKVKNHALYHAACVMSAGFIATLLRLAGKVLSEASDGSWRALLPLAKGTLRNVEAMGPEKATTGPQVRGDNETVRAHAEALRVFDPGLAMLYNLLSAEMTEKKEKKTLDPLLLEVLACPKCKGELEYRKDEDALICHGCRLRFRIEDGIPVMLIEEAEKF